MLAYPQRPKKKVCLGRHPPFSVFLPIRHNHLVVEQTETLHSLGSPLPSRSFVFCPLLAFYVHLPERLFSSRSTHRSLEILRPNSSSITRYLEPLQAFPAFSNIPATDI